MFHQCTPSRIPEVAFADAVAKVKRFRPRSKLSVWTMCTSMVSKSVSCAAQTKLGRCTSNNSVPEADQIGPTCHPAVKLVRSQSGPRAGFSVTPSSMLTRIQPLSNHICGFGRLLDSDGHHRAVCVGLERWEGGVPHRECGCAHLPIGPHGLDFLVVADVTFGGGWTAIVESV